MSQVVIVTRRRDENGILTEPRKVAGDETDKEKILRLEQEKQSLLASMMEMSSYMALQDERLAGQESAIMELSTLIAMNAAEGGDS